MYSMRAASSMCMSGCRKILSSSKSLWKSLMSWVFWVTVAGGSSLSSSVAGGAVCGDCLLRWCFMRRHTAAANGMDIVMVVMMACIVTVAL